MQKPETPYFLAYFVFCFYFIYFTWCVAMPAPPDSFLSTAHSWIERAGSIPRGGCSFCCDKTANCDFEFAQVAVLTHSNSFNSKHEIVVIVLIHNFTMWGKSAQNKQGRLFLCHFTRWNRILRRHDTRQAGQVPPNKTLIFYALPNLTVRLSCLKFRDYFVAFFEVGCSAALVLPWKQHRLPDGVYNPDTYI